MDHSAGRIGSLNPIAGIWYQEIDEPEIYNKQIIRIKLYVGPGNISQSVSLCVYFTVGS
jgi:hypothetical protein